MNDFADIIAARSRFNARKTDSTLIAWICSADWTSPDSDSTPRGMVVRRGKWEWSDSTSGEFAAYTRDHVDPFA